MALHGDKQQAEREDVLRAFRAGTCSLLLTTDVMSRGIDVPKIAVVVNYDLPNSVHDLMHRAGRTARAGKNGTCVSFFDKFQDRRVLYEVRDVFRREGKPVPLPLQRL